MAFIYNIMYVLYILLNNCYNIVFKYSFLYLLIKRILFSDIIFIVIANSFIY